MNERLGGYEVDKAAPARVAWAGSREALSFPEFYAQSNGGSRGIRMVCTGPVTYKGYEQCSATSPT